MNKEGWSPLHGIICLWWGAVIDIPEGWVVCDGTNGTPDMEDRFPVGAGTRYPQGSYGGNRSHSHWSQSQYREHNHVAQCSSANPALESGVMIADASPNGSFLDETVDHDHNVTIETDTHRHEVQTNTNWHIPEYSSFFYIMKL